MPEQKSAPKPPDMKEIMADYDKATKFMSETPAEVWEGLGQKTAMSVFAETAKNIKPYQEFLKLQKIDPEKVTSMEEFYKLPMLDKYNYVQVYGFNEVNSVKAGQNLYSISLSSGTIDEPTVWPRYFQYEEFLPAVFELFMRQYWQIDKKSTLFINAFALGPWIAGFTVHQAIRPLTQKFNLTLATPGADIDSIGYIVAKLSKYYDQTIIWSYPTFARTVLDRLEDLSVDFKKLKLRMFIAGEGHTVEWRQYINKIISGDKDDLTSIIDGYGVTESGLMAMGSALTNLVRDLAFKNEKLREDLFGKTDCVPSLFQYNPANYFIEERNGEVLVTTKSTTPLVRYNIYDRGGVIKFREMEEILKKHGYDYKKLLRKKGLPLEIVWQQPFVYCFGRRDIHSFKLATDHDKEQHQLFYVLLELRSGVSYNKRQMEKMTKKYHDLILKQLKVVNFDFADAFRIDPKVGNPNIRIFSSGTGPFTEDIGRTKPKLIVK